MSDRWQDFDVAAARWRLGELPPERLPEASVSALSAGCETPSLLRLAVMDGSTWSEIEPVLEGVFDERGCPLPSIPQAVASVANDMIRRMVAGELDPRDATIRLSRLVWKAPDRPPFEDLLVFSGLSDSWESADAGYLDPEAVRAAVLDEAKKLLARGGVTSREARQGD
jgi:hypothetical protein